MCRNVLWMLGMNHECAECFMTFIIRTLPPAHLDLEQASWFYSTSCRLLSNSFSPVVLHEPVGMPHFLFPGGACLSVMHGCLVLFIHRTWPSHLQVLCFKSSTVLLLVYQHLLTSLLGCCSQWNLRIWWKQLSPKPLRLFSFFWLALQGSEEQRTEYRWTCRSWVWSFLVVGLVIFKCSSVASLCCKTNSGSSLCIGVTVSWDVTAKILEALYFLSFYSS